MKKIVSFIFILSLVFMLVSCGNIQQVPTTDFEETQTSDTPDVEAPSEHNEIEDTEPAETEAKPIATKTQSVQIALAREGNRPYRHPLGWENEVLNTFTHLYELDFTIVMDAIGGFGDIEFTGGSHIIWSDVLIRDFYVVILEQAHIDDEFVFVPYGCFGYVEEILPGQAFVINSYIEIGEVFPGVGIAFTDGSGNKQYFGIQPNYSDEGPSHFLREFEDRADEFAGAQVVFAWSQPPDWEPGGPYLSIVYN